MVVRKHHVAFSLSVILLFAVIALHTCERLSSGLRVASFNVNQYPEQTENPERLFEVVRQLDAPIVGLQEIGDINATRQAAMNYLGPHWRVRVAANCSTRCVGYLYDTKRVDVVRAITHDGVRVFPGSRPAYEVVAKVDGKDLTLVNVHLKAGALETPMRLRQLRELGRIMDDVNARHDRVILLGDFNSVGADDRAALERFSASSGMSWATSVLECSHYMRRPGRCATTTLDHAFTTSRPFAVEEAGACADRGCDPGASCPVWTREVSDHCPFVVQMR